MTDYKNNEEHNIVDIAIGQKRTFKSNAKLLIFLLWHDKKSRGVTKFIAISTVSLIGALWGFPLGNLSLTGVMPPETQRMIRIIGTCLLLSISLLSFAILAFVRYRKYRDPTKLTDEELNDFLKHMK